MIENKLRQDVSHDNVSVLLAMKTFAGVISLQYHTCVPITSWEHLVVFDAGAAVYPL